MFGKVFRDSVFGRWLRGDTGRYDLCVAMSGVRMGDRLLSLATRDSQLAAAIAARTGLSGRAVAVVADERAAHDVTRAAEQAGVFLEPVVGSHDTLRFDPGSFDLIVVDQTKPPLVDVNYSEVRRLLRPGGRVVVIAGGPSRRGGSPVASGDTLRETMRVNFPAARVLAERAGWIFVEGLKGR